MSHEDRRPEPPTNPRTEATNPAERPAPSGTQPPEFAEEYRRYRQAEREEEQRLERYEQTSSTDTTREKDDSE